MRSRNSHWYVEISPSLACITLSSSLTSPLPYSALICQFQILQPCPFPEKIPIELRNGINSLLLIYDELSTSRSPFVGNIGHGLYSGNYGLSPSTLRTCRQVYKEPSSISYGSNTFFVDCTRRQLIESPLTRTNTKFYHEAEAATMNSEFPTFKLVQR
jgi:hypothetical protein